jgi:hypothetical protein
MFTKRKRNNRAAGWRSDIAVDSYLGDDRFDSGLGHAILSGH